MLNKRERRDLVYAERVRLIDELSDLIELTYKPHYGNASDVLCELQERMEQIRKASVDT